MLILGVAISVINILILQGRAEKVMEANEVAKGFLIPAELKVTKIIVADCEECFDIENVLESIKKQNVDVTEERTLYLNENEAKNLVNKYSIKKIPTLIISGEINKTEQLKSYFKNIGEVKDERSLIFIGQKPPYYDVSSAKVIGEVSVINIVDSLCKECVPLNQVTNALKQSGVAVTEEKTYEYDSKDSVELINKFNISRIPAILISNEVNYYNEIKEQIQELTNEKNGYYALHATSPPYRDLSKNEVVGFVKIILLNDSSCKECYNVNINKQILLRLGVFVKEETAIDIADEEGQALIFKYGIEKVPALLLSPETENYPLFVQVWESVGSVEEDGWYVMRKPENLGTYRNLKTNEVKIFTS